MDAVSNTAYLLSKNIPINTIYKKTKSITNEMVEFSNLREELLKTEFSNRAKPTEAKQKKIDSLEKQISEHRLATAYYRGFIQSIAIDVTQKNEHTAHGLNKDIEKLLNKTFRNDDESLNKAGKAITSMMNFGVNGEDLLLKVSELVAKGDSNVAKATAQTLEEIGNHIKELKDKGDIANYLQEYLATPGTSLVNVGSVMTQTPDVIAKVILHEHLVEQAIRDFTKKNSRKPNASEMEKINEDAAIEAVTAFIDYKMNIPRELRFLEQTGITSFISFWSRIQKVMLNSLRDNPVNALTTILLTEMLGMSGATIFDASIADKWSNGSLMGGPTPGMDILFPTKLF